MKRKVTALLTALLLTLTLCAPTLAWTEYGAIYDETPCATTTSPSTVSTPCPS